MKRSDAAVVGAGALVCIPCCAGPILGVLGAIGIGSAVGVVLFGCAGLALALVVSIVVLRGRRRAGAANRAGRHGAPTITPVPVPMPTLRRPG